MERICVERAFAAPRERVFQVLADHESWPRWAGVREVVLRQRGAPTANGLGAIRVWRSRGLAIEEEVIGFAPPERLEFRVVGGAPVRDCEGEVRLAKDGSGSKLRFQIRFEPRIPFTAGFLRRRMERELSQALERLARLYLPDGFASRAAAGREKGGNEDQDPPQ